MTLRPLLVTVAITHDDVRALERAGEALIRSGDTHTAIELLALSLRLRAECGFYGEERTECPVT
jgi:hypothetical protein